MTSFQGITLEVPDPAAAEAFYQAAFGLDEQIGFRAVDTAIPATDGFRGFTLSLVVAGPGTVDSLVGTALTAGATVLKPVTKSFWGYGGVLRAPDGAIWKVASSAKKDKAPVTRAIDDVVLLLGCEDLAASKAFYVDRGLAVAKSYGRTYVEFSTPSSPVKLALYRRKALAKDAGVAPEGGGSHRLVLNGDQGGTDPSGFVWEPSSTTGRTSGRAAGPGSTRESG